MILGGVIGIAIVAADLQEPQPHLDAEECARLDGWVQRLGSRRDAVDLAVSQLDTDDRTRSVARDWAWECFE